MAWLKALHFASLAIWCAGLLYLPSVALAHPRAHDPALRRQMTITSRVTFILIASPAAVLTTATGIAMIFLSDSLGRWLLVKLALVSLMALYHLYCGWIIGVLRENRVIARPRLHLAGMLLPVSLVPAVLYLALGKPL